MPGSRKYQRSAKRALTKKYGSPKKVIPAVKTLQAAVRRLNVKFNKTIETKRILYTDTDGKEIFHNNFITLNPVVLATTRGTGDDELASRIGDAITLRGVSIKFMVELNERYSDVTFRFMLVKCAKGDVPTRATLWKGISGNKMIDFFDTERYTIIKSKTFKIQAPNTATIGGAFGGLVPTGYNDANNGNQVLSRATKIIKFWIPGSKFVKSSVITYENNSQQVKFYDYHAILYAYSNYSTSQDVYYVGRCGDYVQQMYFKDA